MEWTQWLQAAGQMAAAVVAAWAVSRSQARSRDARLVEAVREQERLTARVSALHADLARLASAQTQEHGALVPRAEMALMFEAARAAREHTEDTVRGLAGNVSRIHERLDAVHGELNKLLRAALQNGRRSSADSS